MIDLELDKLKEECGVFGIYSRTEDVALNTSVSYTHLICGLQIIYVRVQQGAGLTYVLGSLYSALANTKDNNSNMQPLIFKEHQAFLECLNKFIEISYNYPEPEVRAGLSLIHI